jgi:G3E family GTPase
MNESTRTPVLIVTGFLGAGKSSLVNNLLRDPAMENTALIINEFGDVSIDDDLIEHRGETVVELAGGCVCCAMQATLAETLAELNKASGSSIERVLIETTGLANVGPVVHTITADESLRSDYEVSHITTLVDAVNGAATLDMHPEAVEQIAVADLAVITKTDLAPNSAELHDRIRQLNQTIEIEVAPFGAISATALLDRSVCGFTYSTPSVTTGQVDRPHDAHIKSVSIVRDEPFAPRDLETFWASLGAKAGANLLRIKGLVAVDGHVGPALIQGAQDTLSAIQWLDEWPSVDRRSRIVFIGWDLDQDEIEELVGKR